jgi:hypothetical protein
MGLKRKFDMLLIDTKGKGPPVRRSVKPEKSELSGRKRRGHAVKRPLESRDGRHAIRTDAGIQ